MIKRLFKVYFIWQEEKEEKWLKNMAMNGWQLIDYSIIRYTFRKTEPKDYIYKIDYKNTSNTDLDEYIKIYNDAGWEHVTSWFKWHYFRTSSENIELDIYSDNDSKIKKYKSQLKVLYIVLILNILNVINLFFNSSVNEINGSTIFTLKSLVIMVILLLFYAIIRIHRKIRKLYSI